jgi:hypothetical protein
MVVERLTTAGYDRARARRALRRLVARGVVEETGAGLRISG